MPQQKTLRLILGDQLDELHAWFKTPDKDVTYVIMEIRQETDYVKHHIQKVAAFFTAMRAFSARLSELGHKVIYIRLYDRQNMQTIAANLQKLLATQKFARVEYLLPDEYRLMVTGNFALLSGVHPDAVDEWYLGIYIDAIQWVELPITRAMSQFADGGRIATKPYTYLLLNISAP